ncbi:hypothetical protein AYI70_g2066 [Smittium culicis]|uniref:Uncharacterized protein n=2 Tax=Smittium culicis TaxID=133412 RepID=A0A1R1YA42_9FUNG|nr:hypothetical protein AYI70_g2066 [Smittium culicis]
MCLDWTESWQNPETSTVLSPGKFGGNGRGPEKCLYDGFEMGWLKSYPVPGCITRDYKNGNSPGPFWPMEAIAEMIKNSSPTFANFTTNLENGCHGIVHLGIGGDFLTMHAPNE